MRIRTETDPPVTGEDDADAIVKRAAQAVVRALETFKLPELDRATFLRAVWDRVEASYAVKDSIPVPPSLEALPRGARRIPCKPENPSQAVAHALDRGKLARVALEKDEGGSKSSEQIAELLGVTRQAVDQRRRARHLVAWRDAAGHWRFPVWQFDPKTAQPYPGLPSILAALPGDPWSDMIFFLSRDETLDARPLDLLRCGRAKRVVPAALRYSGQGT